jgi:outer membrane protein assembly factor BamB
MNQELKNTAKQTSTLLILLLIIPMIINITCSEGQNQENKNTLNPKYEIISGNGNWPSFRGEQASGVVDLQNLPENWEVKSGNNIKWKTPIPGLAHSSPVIWENKIYITTAISSKDKASFRHGLYGDGDASEDRSKHRWILYCLDKKSGIILWESLIKEGVPIDKRHIKSTYANSTPATDGRYVAVFIGSEGLFVFNVDGKFLWYKDLGRIDAGAYDHPNLEWGSATSPIIFKDLVIVQVDHQGDDFIIGCDIHTGKTIWKTERNELPSWGTPTIYKGENRVELITNSSNFIYGYNPETGEELWRLGGSSKITTPTPIYYKNTIIVCSGRRPEAPVFAIKAGANGDISLPKGQTSNEFIVWSKTRRGPYMPTPIIYRGYLYTINNNGRFFCYNLKSGKEIYKESIPHKGGGFSASPVASDGKIYLPSEDGDIFVVQAGKKFKLLSSNNMGELLMATPAISDSILYVRSQYHLFAVGN